MLSFIALVKLAMPTNSPGSPTPMLVSEYQSAIPDGEAMKTTRIAPPGASNAAARAFSLSSSRVSRETRACSALRRRSGVDLAQLAGRPLHGFLGRHLAAAGLRVHHGDDELVPR